MTRRSRLPVLPFTPRSPSTTPSTERVEVQRFGARHPLVAMEAHRHAFFELLYVAAGEGSHRVGDERVAVRAGDLFVIAPGEAHDARAMRDARGWMVLFAADALGAGRSEADAFVGLPDELLLLAFLRPEGVRTGRFALPRPRRAVWERACRELEEELASPALGHAEAVRARLTLLLIEAARLAAPKLAGITPARRPLLGEVFRFIEARHAHPIGLADVARAVGRSPAYLTDVVRRETGRSVGGWIRERRMAEARRRLVQTEEPIGAIASAVGYDDPSYFVRQFRRAHGMTPLAWRHAAG